LLLATSGGDDATVKLWEAQSGRLLLPIRWQTGWAYGLSIATDSRTLATGDQEGNVKLWDMSSGRELRTIRASVDAV
jgi:WD40 repeat protein